MEWYARTTRVRSRVVLRAAATVVCRSNSCARAALLQAWVFSQVLYRRRSRVQIGGRGEPVVDAGTGRL